MLVAGVRILFQRWVHRTVFLFLRFLVVLRPAVPVYIPAPVKTPDILELLQYVNVGYDPNTGTFHGEQSTEPPTGPSEAQSTEDSGELPEDGVASPL